MPAAAVTPAPIAYIKVVAVKKLVVGCRSSGPGSPAGELLGPRLFLPSGRRVLDCARPARAVYFEQIRVFQAGAGLHSPAWDNGIGPWFY